MEKKIECHKKMDTITMRCSREVKKQLMEKAKESNKTISTYLLDAGIAGLESGQGRRRKWLRH